MKFDEKHGIQVTAEASNFLDDLFNFLRGAAVQRACDNSRAADHSPDHPVEVDRYNMEEAVWECMDDYVGKLNEVGTIKFRELPINMRLEEPLI